MRMLMATCPDGPPVAALLTFPSMITGTDTPPRHGILPLLASMLATRLELAALDIEAHLQTTLLALIAAFVAVVLGLIAFAFVGIAVIVFFWETYRIPAAIAVIVAYGTFALLIGFWARSVWKMRPAALANTMHELELDRDAFRCRS
jgi:uncharacterized membrane protein YqjE